jgi:formamidase
MGTAPSAELLAKWTKRETDLIATDPHRAAPGAASAARQRHSRARSRVLSSIGSREAARTAPPRENGGNQDIKNFTAGTRVFYPSSSPGRSCRLVTCTFAGRWRDHVLRRDRDGRVHGPARRSHQGRHGPCGVGENAIFMPGIRDPQYSEWIAFSGVSVDRNGKQHYLDSQLSYANACNHAIDYLMKFGYTDIQAYMILGSAPVEGRFSGWWTSRTRARRSTSPGRSSTSTSARRRAEAAPGEARPSSAESPN